MIENQQINMPKPAKRSAEADDTSITTKKQRVDKWDDIETLLPRDWQEALIVEISKDYFKAIKSKLTARGSAVIYPPINQVFDFARGPLNKTRVVILGQGKPIYTNGYRSISRPGSGSRPMLLGCPSNETATIAKKYLQGACYGYRRV
jgi:hypothetical protein